MRLRICPLLALALTCRMGRAEAPPASAPDHALVLGFDRFLANNTDDPRGGQLLLGELNCISCHQASAGAGRWLLKKQAPVLGGIGGRVRAASLKAFLSDPQAAKPG